jgi:hypothetical protein
MMHVAVGQLVVSAFRRTCVTASAALLASTPVAGHHSLTEYDGTRRITLSVVVREFHFVNPHPYLLVDGPAGARGGRAASQSWRLELDNRFELVNIGMTSGTFARGDQLTVAGAPGRDEKPILYVRELERPDDGFRYEQAGNSPRIVRPGSGRSR